VSFLASANHRHLPLIRDKGIVGELLIHGYSFVLPNAEFLELVTCELCVICVIYELCLCRVQRLLEIVDSFSALSGRSQKGLGFLIIVSSNSN
jgi:hypothetical protein